MGSDPRTPHGTPHAGPVSEKVDFKRTLPGYRAPRGRFAIVDVPDARYLMIDGHGDPDTAQEFTEALEALYPVAYALKFASKGELGRAATRGTARLIGWGCAVSPHGSLPPVTGGGSPFAAQPRKDERSARGCRHRRAQRVDLRHGRLADGSVADVGGGLPVHEPAVGEER